MPLEAGAKESASLPSPLSPPRPGDGSDSAFPTAAFLVRLLQNQSGSRSPDTPDPTVKGCFLVPHGLISEDTTDRSHHVPGGDSHCTSSDEHLCETSTGTILFLGGAGTRPQCRENHQHQRCPGWCRQAGRPRRGPEASLLCPRHCVRHGGPVPPERGYVPPRDLVAVVAATVCVGSSQGSVPGAV